MGMASLQSEGRCTCSVETLEAHSSWGGLEQVRSLHRSLEAMIIVCAPRDHGAMMLLNGGGSSSSGSHSGGGNGVKGQGWFCGTHSLDKGRWNGGSS